MANNIKGTSIAETRSWEISHCLNAHYRNLQKGNAHTVMDSWRESEDKHGLKLTKLMSTRVTVNKIEKPFSWHHGRAVRRTLMTWHDNEYQSISQKLTPGILLHEVIWLKRHTEINLTSRTEHTH